MDDTMQTTTINAIQSSIHKISIIPINYLQYGKVITNYYYVTRKIERQDLKKYVTKKIIIIHTFIFLFPKLQIKLILFSLVLVLISNL